MTREDEATSGGALFEPDQATIEECYEALPFWRASLAEASYRLDLYVDSLGGGYRQPKLDRIARLLDRALAESAYPSRTDGVGAS